MSGLVGLIFTIGLLFAVAGDVEYFVGNELGVSDIFFACSGPDYGLALLYISCINCFFSGMASFTVSTRIGFASKYNELYSITTIISTNIFFLSQSGKRRCM